MYAARSEFRHSSSEPIPCLSLPTIMRVIVITGATAGIGRATAIEFAKRGDKIALLARGELALRTTAEEVKACGGTATRLDTDLALVDEGAARRPLRHRPWPEDSGNPARTSRSGTDFGTESPSDAFSATATSPSPKRLPPSEVCVRGLCSAGNSCASCSEANVGTSTPNPLLLPLAKFVVG